MRHSWEGVSARMPSAAFENATPDHRRELGVIKGEQVEGVSRLEETPRDWNQHLPGLDEGLSAEATTKWYVLGVNKG